MTVPLYPDTWPKPERRLTPTPFPITPGLIWLALAAVTLGIAIAEFI